MDTCNESGEFADIVNLQWSHDLSAVDTSKRFTQNSRILDKLQWGHDLSTMDTTGTEAAIGATQLLQWSHDLSAMDT